MDAATTLAPKIGVTKACEAMGVSRSSYYRSLRPKGFGRASLVTAHPRALSDDERREILDVCHSSRFVDAAPA
jgi:hypothetical protein